jgi:4-alpha-glucanotransferase
VREVMKRYGFPGMKILMFAFNEDNPDHPYLPFNFDRECVVYTGTHDNNTAVGWLRTEADAEEKARLARYIGRPTTDEKETAWEMIRLALASVADLAIVPVQDVLGLDEKARMNTPSSSTGNWKWRCGARQVQQAPFDRLAALTVTYGRDRPSR